MNRTFLHSLKEGDILDVETLKENTDKTTNIQGKKGLLEPKPTNHDNQNPQGSQQSITDPLEETEETDSVPSGSNDYKIEPNDK